MAVFRRPSPPRYIPRARTSAPRRRYVPGGRTVLDAGTVMVSFALLLTATLDTDPSVTMTFEVALNADIGVISLVGTQEGHRSPINPSTEGHRA